LLRPSPVTPPHPSEVPSPHTPPLPPSGVNNPTPPRPQRGAQLLVVKAASTAGSAILRSESVKALKRSWSRSRFEPTTFPSKGGRGT
jgi:hypothetical protein